ncbi:MAG: hypothetical protein U0R17_01955 [Acidimicrobiia bacterium]
MTNIKTNLRDGAYVALGAAALGVAQLSKKRDSVKAHIDNVSSKVEPVIKDASGKVIENLTPIATKISPVAEKVSNNIGPVATQVVKRVKETSNQAFESTKKIACEAKRRIS